MRNFFALFLVLLSLLSNSAYTAAPETVASLSCTFEPGMSKGLEVLAYLDDQYKGNSSDDSVFLIKRFVRTGLWKGKFENKEIEFKGLRQGKPANANETCLMYKVIMRTTAQTYSLESLKDAARNLQQLVTEKKQKDLQHQLIVLIVSLLTYSQQTVHPYQITNNTKNILTKSLDEVKVAYNNQKLETIITFIKNSSPFKTANDIIKRDQETAIKEGARLEGEAERTMEQEQKKQYYQQALSLYRDIAKQGNQHARYLIGTLYAKGLGLIAKQRENKQAISYLMQSMGEDREKVLKLLQEMANSGNILASLALKKTYIEGLLGVSKDLQEARKWLEKAAEQNYELALFYLKDGPSQNKAKAMELLTRAAKQHHVKAQAKLKEITPSKKEITLPQDEPEDNEDQESGTMVFS